MPNIPTSGAYNPATETLGQVKARIARVIQGASQANALGEAGDALADAVRWWNRRDWRLLLAQAPTITASAEESEYPLPSDLKKIYDVRTSLRPLYYASQRDYDRLIWNQTNNTPTHYTPYLIGQQLKIKLIPTPVNKDTVTVRYYKLLELPSSDTSPLGWPDIWVEPIVNYAKALLTADRRDNRASFFMRIAQEGYKEAKSDDLYQPDEDVGLKTHGPGYRPDHSWSQVRRHYGY